jgi:hypothetical protein
MAVPNRRPEVEAARMDIMNKQSAFISRSGSMAITFALLTAAVIFVYCLPTAIAQQPQTAQSLTPAARESSIGAKLHQAARTGDLALLRSQLKSGVNPNVRDEHGRTALMDAVNAGHISAVKVLINAGADVNAHSTSGATALIEAAETGRIRTARLLLQHGANVNAAGRSGTALEVAERTGHMNVAALLRQAGARPSGHSLGDTVCVRPWGGDGYCGVVEAIDRNNYQIRVTRIVGCKDGCPARAECSANRTVGGADGIETGDTVNTVSWCLTDTGVQP